MCLRSSGFLTLACGYFILACIIGAHSNKYSQDEIDSAFLKLINRGTFFKKLNGQLGCWPQNIIPYTIQDRFTPEQRMHIYRHVYQIQNRTCVRWVEKKSLTGVKKHVEFEYTSKEYDCHTSETVDNTSQHGITTRITLNDHCFDTESIIHEMLHALGFLHEHQRIDRDCYVIVDDESAQTNKNFKIVYDDLTFEKWPYDKRSLTHYTRLWLTHTLRDRLEPFYGILWKHRLGDSYGWWGEIGKSYGKLTCLDAYKINYRFCGAPDFCATRPEICQQIEEEESREGCKDLYMDIAQGYAKHSKQKG